MSRLGGALRGGVGPGRDACFLAPSLKAVSLCREESRVEPAVRAAEVLSGHLFHSALQPAFLGLCCVPSTAGGAVVSETDEVPALRELIVCEETDNIRVNLYYMR